MKYCSVFITVKDKKEAKKIGTELVKNGLVACVNIIDNVESIYRWQGKIQNEKEVMRCTPYTKNIV